MTVIPGKQPLVSVLMVARNAEATIGLALNSLLLQSYQHWECLIVDDASTDSTAAILAGLPDPRFRVQYSCERLGRGGARNLAMTSASGLYLASLDADDFLFEDALAAQVSALEQDSALSACTGSLLLFSPDYMVLGRRRTQIKPGLHSVSSPLSTRIPLGSTMLRASCVGFDRFESSYRRSEDRDFFDRVLNGRSLRVLAAPTYAYRWCLNLQDVMEGLRNREILFRRCLKSRPLRVGLLLLWTRLKLSLYPMLFRCGLWEALDRFRAIPPTTDEELLFERTLSRLRARTPLSC